MSFFGKFTVVRHLRALISLIIPLFISSFATSEPLGKHNWVDSLFGVNPSSIEFEKIFSGNDAATSGSGITEVGVARDRRNNLFLRLKRPSSYPDNIRILIYLDLDGNPSTGRPRLGNELMLQWRENRVSVDAYGSFEIAKADRYFAMVADDFLYLSLGGVLGYKNISNSVRMRIVVDELRPNRTLGVVNWLSFDPSNITSVDRPIKDEVLENDSFIQISEHRRLKNYPQKVGGIMIEPREMLLENYVLDHSEYRTANVIRPSRNRARIILGREQMGDIAFYPGFIYHDARGNEIFEIFADGRLISRINANLENKRQHLVVSNQLIDPSKTEKIEIRAIGASGWHRIERVLLLHALPEASPPSLNVERLQLGDRQVTWTTSLPANCIIELEYPSGVKTHALYPRSLNHRYILPEDSTGLPGRVRILAQAANGSRYTSEWKQWPEAPVSVSVSGASGQVSLVLANPDSDDWDKWPALGGIPFPKGQLSTSSYIYLTGPDNQSLEFQSRPLTFWPDGTIRWLLVEFIACSSKHDGTFVLNYRPGKPKEPVLPSSGNEWILGNLNLKLAADGVSSAPVVLSYKTEPGSLFSNFHAKETIGTSGFQFDVTAIRYHGTPWTRIQLSVINAREAEEFSDISHLYWELPGVESAVPVELIQWHEKSSLRVVDGEIILPRSQNELKLEGKASGIRVSEFWQRYPRSLSVNDEQIRIGLLPSLDASEFESAIGTVDEHRLFFWLSDVNGKPVYKLRQGMSFTTEIWLGKDGAIPPLDRPILLMASPDWIEQSQAAGLTGAKAKEGPFGQKYLPVLDWLLEFFKEDRKETRAFGFLNFGDWWGERQINWGNNEYDTAHGMFLHFFMTGNPTFFTLGEQAARHYRDVDIIHHHKDPTRLGKAYLHAVGHVGDYYRVSPGPGGTVRAIFDVGHSWTAGMVDHYLLTGEKRSLTTAKLLADNYNTYYLDGYDFTNTRVPGWHLLLTLAVYRATNDPFYINAAHIIVERLMERHEDPPFPGDTPGGWSRMLVPGHCRCTPHHHGNAGFMVAVLMSGLREYFELTADQRVFEVMEKVAGFLVDDMWVEEKGGFRYTSCPKSAVGSWSNLSIFDGLGFVYSQTTDSELQSRLSQVILTGVEPGLETVPEFTRYQKQMLSFYLRVIPRIASHMNAVFEKYNKSLNLKEND